MRVLIRKNLMIPFSLLWESKLCVLICILYRVLSHLFQERLFMSMRNFLTTSFLVSSHSQMFPILINL